MGVLWASVPLEPVGEVLTFSEGDSCVSKVNILFLQYEKENLWKVTTKINTNKGKKIYVYSVNRIAFMLSLFPLKF